MKRFSTLLIAVWLCQSIFAQVKVVPAESSGNTPGVFYALPQTVFKIDVTVEHTRTIPGPFSDYAEKYLGITDAPRLSNDEYNILDLQVESFTRPDPDQIYFVQYGERSNKDERSLSLKLSQAGILVGADKANAEGSAKAIELAQVSDKPFFDKPFSKITNDNLYEKIDTVVRRITIDTLTIEKNFYRSTWQQKTSEQKARDAADFISRIKENRFLLMSGYQEVNYGESIAYMDQELKKLYSEYLSLFIGIEKTMTYHYSFLFTPDAGQPGQSSPLFRFSENRGLFSTAESIGENVFIRITASGIAEKIADAATIKSNPNAENNGYYYRIPEFADVEIEYEGRSIYKANMMINQLGAVSVTPFYNLEIEMHPGTGGIKSMQIR
ncbi:MAG: DUF4831 family protein [Bacteroidales bacterium]|nr:DUF4831 family protein [Bacteroidales bacterium]MCF8388858.1 DUF4831 family protein [Bacteroidales bacterium]MCF8398549.1 DUF4831 family protein [Bacteroidales bacterium]